VLLSEVTICKWRLRNRLLNYATLQPKVVVTTGCIRRSRIHVYGGHV